MWSGEASCFFLQEREAGIVARDLLRLEVQQARGRALSQATQLAAFRGACEEGAIKSQARLRLLQVPSMTPQPMVSNLVCRSAAEAVVGCRQTGRACAWNSSWRAAVCGGCRRR